MPYTRERIFPMPWLDLKINFGGAIQAYEPGHTEPFAVCAESWWVGLWSAYHIAEWPLDTQFFMVEFKPGGAYPFLHLPLSELHDQVVSLDAIWGRFAAEIRERLYAAPTIEAQLVLLESLLLDRLTEPPHGLSAIHYAIRQIVQSAWRAVDPHVK